MPQMWMSGGGGVFFKTVPVQVCKQRRKKKVRKRKTKQNKIKNKKTNKKKKTL